MRTKLERRQLLVDVYTLLLIVGTTVTFGLLNLTDFSWSERIRWAGGSFLLFALAGALVYLAHNVSPPKLVRPAVIEALLAELHNFATLWNRVWADEIHKGHTDKTREALSKYRGDMLASYGRVLGVLDLSAEIEMSIQDFDERLGKLATRMWEVQISTEFVPYGNKLVELVDTKLIPEIEKEYPK